MTAPNPGEPPFYGLANGTRVAFSLIGAGVKNVAILDGGYPKWAAEGKEKKTEPKGAPAPGGSPYKGKINKNTLAAREYIKSQIKKAGILDARDAEVYFGVTIEPFANKPGHIPSAKSLPAPWIWDLKTAKAGEKNVFLLHLQGDKDPQLHGLRSAPPLAWEKGSEKSGNHRLLRSGWVRKLLVVGADPDPGISKCEAL